MLKTIVVTTYESSIVFLIAAFVLVKNSVFDNVFYPYYSSLPFIMFSIFVKCGNNRILFNDKRSLLRNITFNLIRNFMKPLIYPMMFGNGSFNMSLVVAVFSATLFFTLLF